MESARADFERLYLFFLRFKTLRVYSKIYLRVIWCDKLLCRKLDVTMATVFGKTCSPNFVLVVLMLLKIYLNAGFFFHLFRSLCTG